MMGKYKLICLFIWIHLSISAQDVITSFLDKHVNDDSLKIVSIGKQMIERMDTLTANNAELKEALKGLETIRIISSKDKDLDNEYYNSAKELLSESKGLEEFFLLDEENMKLTVMVRKSKGAVKELILLSNQKEEFSLISVTGRINLDVLLKYSDRLDINVLKELHTIKHNQ
jgi:hypothetical protein